MEHEDKPVVDSSIFDVDLFRLDKEWTGQAKLYFRWAKKLAEARADLEEEKASLELTEATLDKQIREDPASFDVSKISEKAIASALLVCKKYQRAQEKHRKAQHKVNLLAAAVTALDHRKKALEKCVDLHGQNYFAEPRAKTDAGKAAADHNSKQEARRPKKD